MIRFWFKNKEHLQAAVAITTKERLGFGAQRKKHSLLTAGCFYKRLGGKGLLCLRLCPKVTKTKVAEQSRGRLSREEEE